MQFTVDGKLSVREHGGRGELLAEPIRVLSVLGVGNRHMNVLLSLENASEDCVQQ